MSIRYRYYKAQGYVLSEPVGLVTLQEVKDYADALYADNEISEPFMEIVNFEYTEGVDFGYFEAEELIGYFKKVIEQKSYSGACLVVNSDETKGLSNILREAAKSLDLPILSFKSVEEAVDYVSLRKT